MALTIIDMLRASASGFSQSKLRNGMPSANLSPLIQISPFVTIQCKFRYILISNLVRNFFQEVYPQMHSPPAPGAAWWSAGAAKRYRAWQVSRLISSSAMSPVGMVWSLLGGELESDWEALLSEFKDLLTDSSSFMKTLSHICWFPFIVNIDFSQIFLNNQNSWSNILWFYFRGTLSS